MELIQAEQFLYSTLSNSIVTSALATSSSIYSHIAPQNSTFPYITFQLQSPGKDTSIISAHRITSNPTYLISVWGTESFLSLAGIADSIDTLLHRSSSDTYQVLSCVRLSPFSSIEESDGVIYYRLGGLYKLQIQP